MKKRKNKDFREIVVPSEKDNISKFNQCMKSDKMPYIIYADIEFLIRKIDGCANNLEKSSTTKVVEHIPCGNSTSTIWGLDHVENKHTLYRGKVYAKNREYVKHIIDFEKKKKFTVNKKRIKITSRRKSMLFCEKRILKKFATNKNYRKVSDHCHYTGKYRGAAHSICNLKFNVPNEIPVVSHNGPSYDYHFIIKKLVNESEGQFNVLGKTKESTKHFPLQYKKNPRKLIKMVMKVLKVHLTKQNLLIVQDLWQLHY